MSIKNQRDAFVLYQKWNDLVNAKIDCEAMVSRMNNIAQELLSYENHATILSNEEIAFAEALAMQKVQVPSLPNSEIVNDRF